MKIWIDNDGCPRIVRDIVFKLSIRESLPVVVVGNSYSKSSEYSNVQVVVVSGSFDAADNYIADHVKVGDLVITADVPLAHRIVSKGAEGISPHGEHFNKQNIGDRLAMRNLLNELRGGGAIEHESKRGTYGDGDKKQFADSLNKIAHVLKKRATKNQVDP